MTPLNVEEVKSPVSKGNNNKTIQMNIKDVLITQVTWEICDYKKVNLGYL
jgi:hypothetical protein